MTQAQHSRNYTYDSRHAGTCAIPCEAGASALFVSPKRAAPAGGARYLRTTRQRSFAARGFRMNVMIESITGASNNTNADSDQDSDTDECKNSQQRPPQFLPAGSPHWLQLGLAF